MKVDDQPKKRPPKRTLEQAEHRAELGRLKAQFGRADQDLHKANRALRMLSECSQVLVRAEDEIGLLNSICRIIVGTGGYRMCWVGYAERDENSTVRPVAQRGYEDGYLDLINITWADTERGRGPTGMAIRTGKVCTVRNILTDPDFAIWRDQAVERGYSSAAALPLLAEGRAFGSLNVYAAQADAFDTRELGLLTQLADDLAYGIEALRARARRIEAEAALRESEKNFRMLALEANEGILVASDRTAKHVFANRRAAEITGYSIDELL